MRSFSWNRVGASIIVAAAFVSFGCDRKKEQPPAPTVTAPARSATDTSQPDGIPALARRSDKPGTIRPGDWLRVSIDEVLGPNQALTRLTRVSSNGSVSFPLIGPIAATNLDDVAIEKSAGAAYEKAQILSHAHVTVERVYLAQPGDAPTGPLKNFDLVRVDIGDVGGPTPIPCVIRRISADGKLTMPFIGPLKLAGLSSAEAEKAIADSLRSHQVMNNSMVSVITLEAAPPDADHLDLPDGPVYPVPDVLKPAFSRAPNAMAN